MGAENRCEPRLRAYRPVRLQLRGVPEVIETLTKDISLGGIRCICPRPIPANGTVDVVDFLGVLNAWASDPGGPPDFDDSGDVGVLDFLELLNNWGPCP